MEFLPYCSRNSSKRGPSSTPGSPLPFVRKVLQAVLSECYNSSLLLKVFGVEIRGQCPELSKKLKYFSPDPFEEF